MKNNLILTSKLISDFNNFLGNRSTTFLMRHDGVLKNILDLHFRIWKKENEYLEKENKLEVWGAYSELSRTINSIFRQIEERVLKERASYSFFNRLAKHAEKYKSESVSSRQYAESLFSTFYEIFFQHIHDSPERHDIWNHYFPNGWKVTKSNLEDRENIIAAISLSNYLEWAQHRIWQPSEEMDFALNDVSSNLFPEVSPILWAAVLIFIISPYGEDRLRSVIGRPWNFGFMGRVRVFRSSLDDDGEIRKIDNDEEIRTIELTYHIFGQYFPENILGNYINQLQDLTYPEDSLEERRRLRLLYLFRKLLDFLNRREKQ